jgi:hypothetical protein
MQRLLAIALLAGCALSGCSSRRPTPALRTSVKVTGGTIEARKAVALVVLKDLSSTVRPRVLHRLPAVRSDLLNGQSVSALTIDSAEIPSEGTTTVLTCEYTNRSVKDSDQNPVQCPGDGPYWCGGSPILIPTTNVMALQMSGPEVMFDIDGDGTTELVGWPEDGDAFAFLAYDKNGNGIIDNGSELLGNHFAPDAPSGFEAIQSLIAAAGEPATGVLFESSPVFQKLLLWNDRNRNGVSEAGELRPATDILHAIGLGYSTTGRNDPDGNAYRFKSFAEFKSNGGYQQKPIYDVNLAVATQ